MSRTFTYWIDHDERSEFRASVNNPEGNCVFSIDLEDDPAWFEDGWMKHKNDLDGLHTYLVDHGVMTADDKLINQR